MVLPVMRPLMHSMFLKLILGMLPLPLLNRAGMNLQACSRWGQVMKKTLPARLKRILMTVRVGAALDMSWMKPQPSPGHEVFFIMRHHGLLLLQGGLTMASIGAEFTFQLIVDGMAIHRY